MSDSLKKIRKIVFFVHFSRHPRYRKLRAATFVGMACTGVIPMVHMVFHNGLESTVCFELAGVCEVVAWASHAIVFFRVERLVSVLSALLLRRLFCC